MSRMSLASLVLVPVLGFVLGGCEDTCLESDGQCTVSTPCEGLAFTCASPTATVNTLAVGDPVVGGVDALASPGDVVLSNGVVSAVIDALEHPHYVAPTGGQLLDLVSASGDDDSLTHVFQTVGLLPGDSFYYERMTTTQGDGYAAVQVHGRLAGYEDVRVVTRYEIRPCEPGIRVRTEIQNRAVETRIWALVDAWYWSGREAIPFSPGVGRGFEQPGLVDPIEASWEPQPFMLAGSHGERPATYLEVACSEEQLHGFHSDQISVVGTQPRIIQPRSYEVFERFIGVTGGGALGPASDVALELRRQLHGEDYALLRGRVEGAGLGDEVRASVEISRGTGAMSPEERAPITQVVPAADGTFAARVPRGHAYHAQLHDFGRPGDTAEVMVGAGATEEDFGTLDAEDPAALDLSVLLDGVPDFAQIFVRPADQETRDDVSARLFGSFEKSPACAPLLGAPQGGSPACDRVLVRDPVTVLLPAGSYDLFATAGLFATVARETVTLAPGETRAVELSLSRLDITPAGTLGADFHVHGGASFDSTVPDFDRVQAFLAANVDVIAATDHDAVWDYADARAALSADDRIEVLVGLETTGHILFDLTPGEDIPQVIGHWNVWPLPFDAAGPYRGAPWDELVEPGALFDRFVRAGWPADTGVIQLNHPWSAAQFGRDLGFPRAVGVDANRPLPREDDGTGPALVLRTPEGASFSNGDYHTQEVMNGTKNEDLQSFRQYWFYLLNQGIVRAGTGNSDSHGLVDSVVGTPRTLVWTDQTVAVFDQSAFNRAVRNGEMIGTNGPVIEISTTDAAGDTRMPSVQPFAPGAAALIHIRVSAAPWVPVEEIRVIANGQVVRTLQAELAHPADPFGVETTLRFEGDIALSEILPPGSTDAWVVVEAGSPLPLAGDLDCDGIVDTGDNDGDGTVDYRDVDRNDDDLVDATDLEELDGPPETCDRDQEIGPLGHPAPPARGEVGHAFLAVTPGGYPMSFTNPLLFDRDGGGFTGPGLLAAP